MTVDTQDQTTSADTNLKIVEGTTPTIYNDLNDQYNVSTPDSHEIQVSPPMPSDDNIVDLNGVVWQGQTGATKGEHIVPNTAYNLLEVTSTDGNEIEDARRYRQVLSDDSGQIKVDTGDLDPALYFIDIDDLDATLENTFEIVTQDFDVEFTTAQVDQGESTTVSVNSNRGSFPVLVSANGELLGDDLTQSFVKSGSFELVDQHPENAELITIEMEGDTTESFFADGISPGTYTLDFEVADTGVSSTEVVTISSNDGNGGSSELPVDEEVYDAVASLTHSDEVTGSDLTLLRGRLLDGDNVIEGVEVSGGDYTLLQGHLLS
ncbi:hypothetical protein [Natrialba sp. INN-245]|uniref:hypothetical protein n=1 Tax=Natrialba sp. INN-245 TaxID=2690967 RepID=UPI0013113FA1|nr:hypothetical protein [Natrialba sp. INN-245]MWV40984.1 hypothetical protein [Natrialba sp. INN-245]